MLKPRCTDPHRNAGLAVQNLDGKLAELSAPDLARLAGWIEAGKLPPELGPGLMEIGFALVRWRLALELEGRDLAAPHQTATKAKRPGLSLVTSR